MANLKRALVAVPTTAAGLALIAWMSAVPVPLASPEAAKLRLSWSARPERIERCRELTSEELAARGEHMRQRLECEGRFATYELGVMVDGHSVHESVVRGGGIRSDRPIFLLREIDVSPGEHQVRVTFNRREPGTDDDESHEARADTGLSTARDERERVERARRVGAAIPRRLELDTTIDFETGHAVVVTLDPETRSLKLLSRPAPQPSAASRRK